MEFSKTFFKPDELETPALSFSGDGIHFGHGVFRKTKLRPNNAVINPNSYGYAQALLPPVISAFKERFQKASYSA